jgi:glycosyltransferase involved in cell wall biosynthesis
MPVYNAEKYVAQAIISILQQTHTNFELLICDDSSTDNSRKIIDSFIDSRIQRFYNNENQGYLKTCNHLFSKSNGPFIGFQDADDWSEPDRIKLQLKLLNIEKKLAFCGCNFNKYNQYGSRLISKSNYPSNDSEIRKYIREHRNLPFCGASVVVRKEMYECFGGYREFFDRIGYEHFDWYLQMIEKFPVGNITEVLYNYRYVPNSFSRIETDKQYLKYFNREIAFFLKEQRERHGFDALQNEELKESFVSYLGTLKREFLGSPTKIYIRLIKSQLDNLDFSNATKTLLKGLKSIKTKRIYLLGIFLLEFNKTLLKVMIR